MVEHDAVISPPPKIDLSVLIFENVRLGDIVNGNGICHMYVEIAISLPSSTHSSLVPHYVM